MVAEAEKEIVSDFNHLISLIAQGVNFLQIISKHVSLNEWATWIKHELDAFQLIR